MNLLRVSSAVWALAAWVPVTAVDGQTAAATAISGSVADATGAVIPRADVTLSWTGQQRVGQTDRWGHFSFPVPPGTYALTVKAPDFVPYESRPIVLKLHGQVFLPIRLEVAGQAEEIDVDNLNGRSLDPNENGGALVFQGSRLNLLSDDNETLQKQLNALAGPGLGGAGPQMLVDGFSGGRLPPKSSIRSIRINQNPDSAYYDSLGFGRVEVQTRPGSDKFHGALNFAGTDQPFNASNPFSGEQPPYYQFQSDGNLNGPINKGTSFFISENIQKLANNAVVNAINPATLEALSEPLPAPQLTDTFSLRVDREFSPGNFAYLRNEWSQTHVTNSGIAPLVLPEAAFSSNALTNTLQGSDTQVFGPHAVNEARFQYIRTRLRQDPNSTAPSVIVEGAFQAGGSPAQTLRDNQDHFELQDVLEFDHGKHAIRAGFRLREERDAMESSANFNGQYTFPTLGAYQAATAALPNSNGVSGASQFALTVGQPSARLYDDDVGVFAEDDWKLTKNVTLSYGLRFESQSAVPDHADPSPRMGVAWAVHRGKAVTPLVTLRAGYGIFYDRFPVPDLMQAIRQNGRSEIAYLVQDPTFYPSVPPPSALASTEPSIYRVNPSLRSSYDQAGNLTAERTLGRIGAVSSTMLYVHGTHGYLSRNINAPLPGTFDPTVPNSGVRPLGTTQNIYQYSSDSNTNAEILFTNATLQPIKNLFLFGFYVFERQFDESAGAASFPSNSYNVASDYARSTNSHLQSLFASVIWTLPHGFQLQPFLTVHSGAPFDITTGTDLNGDTIYNDRPAFASDLSRPSVVRTPYGALDTAPLPGQQIIPRNYGNSPGFVWLDMQASKNFHLGPRPAAKITVNSAGKPAAPAARPDRPWNLKFQVEVENLLNHTNPGPPVGVLSSPYFGRSLSLANDLNPLTAANRTILVQSFFSF